MHGAPDNGEPRDNETNTRAAIGGPACVASARSHHTYAEQAMVLLENGYEPLPIIPGTKRPAPARWSQVRIDAGQVAGWSSAYGAHGIGLRTGRLVGIDIDVMDPDLAHAVTDLAVARFGPTLMRVGLWPKRLLIYAIDMPIQKLAAPGLEIMGAGQQVVAFATHPGTRHPYYWPLGDTPLELPWSSLPRVTPGGLQTFLAEASALLPRPGGQSRASPRNRQKTGEGGQPERDANGLVIDGRDGWLSTIAFHMLHDAIRTGEAPDPDVLAVRVWQRFVETSDIARPRSSGPALWAIADARRKIRDKLRLLQAGHLPLPQGNAPKTVVIPDALAVADARALLADSIADVCARVLVWHRDPSGRPPRRGIRATVGLGKSRVAREHLILLQKRLHDEGLPHRILVFTPSLALADEVAGDWQAAGAAVSALRGYLARDPRTGQAMCCDPSAVRAAIATGLPVHPTVCRNNNGMECTFILTCAKQRNRDEVGRADVVVAAYDALFSGIAPRIADVGLILVDEGFWPRAVNTRRGLYVDDLGRVPLAGLARGKSADRAAEQMADLDALC